MKVFLTITDAAVQMTARAEGGGGLLGDLFHTVRSGEHFGKLTYDDLIKLGEGEHDIEP